MAYWGASDKLWLSLTGPQRAAAMALLEADGRNPNDATNALGAMINRAQAEGQSLDQHVSRSIYQPTIEDAQRQRLYSIVQSPEFTQLSQLAESRVSGATPDWVHGADHFIAPPNVMLGLEAKEPNKYRDWGPNGSNWSGYDPDTGAYKNKVFEDNSHHFLKLYGDQPVAMAMPNAPVSAAAPPTSTTPATKSDDMDWLTALMGSMGGTGGTGTGGGNGGGFLSGLFGGSGGDAAAITPAAPATTPSSGLSPLPTNGPGGMLTQLFGGPKGGEADTGLALAQNAMTTAGGTRGPLSPLTRQPIDLSRLQQLLASRPMLGPRPPQPAQPQGYGYPA